MNNISRHRKRGNDFPCAGTKKALILSISAMLALTMIGLSSAQTTTNMPPPPPAASATPAPTPAPEAAPSPAPQPEGQPVQVQLPPGYNGSGPGMPPPPPSEPTAADLKPGLNVTLPAQISVSGTAAIVNGQKITMQQLVTAFIKGGGEPMLQELITRTELEQAAAKDHISVSPAEIDAKLAQSKLDLLSHGTSGQTWAQMLASRGLSEDYARNQIYLQLLVEKLALAKQPFSLDGAIHVYHILIATTQLPFGKAPHTDADAKKQIDDIAAQIAAHKLTFQEAAKEYSEDQSNAPKGGDLGWVRSSDGLDESFKDAAFALKEGQISAPVKSQFGWHLIYVPEFGAHATKTELDKAAADTLDQRARQAVQPYVDSVQRTANVENLLIPLPPKSKNLGLGGPVGIQSAPLRVTPKTVPNPTTKSGSAPPPPPL